MTLTTKIRMDTRLSQEAHDDVVKKGGEIVTRDDGRKLRILPEGEFDGIEWVHPVVYLSDLPQ